MTTDRRMVKTVEGVEPVDAGGLPMPFVGRRGGGKLSRKEWDEYRERQGREKLLAFVQDCGGIT